MRGENGGRDGDWNEHIAIVSKIVHIRVCYICFFAKSAEFSSFVSPRAHRFIKDYTILLTILSRAHRLLFRIECSCEAEELHTEKLVRAQLGKGSVVQLERSEIKNQRLKFL